MAAPVVLIDQDGVLADFDAAIDLALTDLGCDPAELQRSTWHTSDDIRSCFGHDVARNIVDRVHTNGFFRNLPVVNGAQKAVLAMIEAGFDVFVCTAPHLRNEGCASEKLLWIAELFPALTNKVVITRDKTLVRGNILIDDKPDIVGVMTPCWEHVMFATPGNNHARKGLVLQHWDSWHDVLQSVLTTS